MSHGRGSTVDKGLMTNYVKFTHNKPTCRLSWIGQIVRMGEKGKTLVEVMRQLFRKALIELKVAGFQDQVDGQFERSMMEMGQEDVRFK